MINLDADLRNADWLRSRAFDRQDLKTAADFLKAVPQREVVQLSKTPVWQAIVARWPELATHDLSMAADSDLRGNDVWIPSDEVFRFDLSEWDEALHPRDEFGQFASKGESGANRASNGDVWVEPLTTIGREFSSDDGYAWHESGPGSAWVKQSATDEDIQAYTEYAGFGYADINATLRGNPPTRTTMLRKMTDKEYEVYAKWMEDGSDEATEPKPPGDGEAFVFDWMGTYHQLKSGEGTRADRFIVIGPTVDEKRKAQSEASADRLNTAISTRGLVLDEPIVVYRASYLPGVTQDDLENAVGREFEEKGFTSTMLGDAGGRLTGYVGWGKWESISRRYGTANNTLVKHQDETGVAMRIKVNLPAGTKVAAIEAARKENLWRQEVRWAEKYGREPKPQTEQQRKDNRSESEILLGAGARFRITRVRRDTEEYGGSDLSLKPVRIVDVEMEYVGGGTSEGR